MRDAIRPSGHVAELALLALLAPGCVIPTPGRTDGDRAPVAEERLQLAEPGVTTRRDVLLRLGEPDLVAPGERTFVYYWRTVPALVVLGGAGGVAGFEIRDATCLVVEFDADGTLRAAALREPEDVPLLPSPGTAVEP